MEFGQDPIRMPSAVILGIWIHALAHVCRALVKVHDPDGRPGNCVHQAETCSVNVWQALFYQRFPRQSWVASKSDEDFVGSPLFMFIIFPFEFGARCLWLPILGCTTAYQTSINSEL